MVAATAVVCATCDCILDMSFLDLPDRPDDDAFDEKTSAEMFDDKTGAETLAFDAAAPPVDAPASVAGLFTGSARTAPDVANDYGDAVDFLDDDDAPIVDDDLIDDFTTDVGDERAYGGEAIILGNIGPTANDFESMLSDATSSIPLTDGIARTFEPVPVYVGQNIQKMIEIDAVLALREGANVAALQLSPFEQHVLSFIDGQRPVARIRKKAGLGAADITIAIGMLSDRNLIVVKGYIKPDVRALLDDDDLDETGEIQLPPPEPSPTGPDARAPVAGTPLVTSVMDLPLDALTPLLPQPSAPRAFHALDDLDDLDDLEDAPVPAYAQAPAHAAVQPAPAQAAQTRDHGEDQEESVFAGGGPVRQAPVLKPAVPRSAGGVPLRAAIPTPVPRSGAQTASPPVPVSVRVAPKLTTTRAGPPAGVAAPAGPASPAPSAPSAPSGPIVDGNARAKAQQMLELGLADLRAGKKARALSYVKMALTFDPGNAKAKGLVNDWANAEKVAKAEAEDELLVADAHLAETQGQYERAAELYKKAIVLKPDEPELRNRLGILFALRLKDYTAATNELMKACELAPDNLAYRSNLGKIFKIADGGPATTLHAGSDSAALTEAARAAAKPSGFLDRLRGGKK